LSLCVCSIVSVGQKLLQSTAHEGVWKLIQFCRVKGLLCSHLKWVGVLWRPTCLPLLCQSNSWRQDLVAPPICFLPASLLIDFRILTTAQSSEKLACRMPKHTWSTLWTAASSASSHTGDEASHCGWQPEPGGVPGASLALTETSSTRIGLGIFRHSRKAFLTYSIKLLHSNFQAAATLQGSRHCMLPEGSREDMWLTLRASGVAIRCDTPSGIV
jgi:hypothetical protein